jgi:hypothetical protein
MDLAICVLFNSSDDGGRSMFPYTCRSNCRLRSCLKKAKASRWKRLGAGWKQVDAGSVRTAATDNLAVRCPHPIN